MDTSLITEEMLKKIILSRVNAEGEKYWIKSITRASRSTLKGTIVEVAPNEENGGGNSTVAFDKFSLVIDGDLKKYEKEINQDYIDTLCENNPEFKTFYNDAMLKIDEKTAEFRLRLVENFYENGYVKNDIKGIFKGVGVKELQEKLYRNRHSEIIAPIDNKFKKIRVIDIKPGQIITADLNPVLESEIGGIRPVLIVSVFENNVIIMPISSDVEKNCSRGKVFALPKGIYEGYFNKDSVVCVDYVKSISKDRLLHNVAEMDAKDFNKVLDLLADSVLGKVVSHSDEDEIEMIFSYEEVAEFEREQALLAQKQVSDEEVEEKPSKLNPNVWVAPKEENKEGYVEFTITDEEVLEMTNKRVESLKASMGYNYINPIIENSGNLKEGIKVAYEVEGEDKKQEFILKRYHASFINDKNKNRKDEPLSKMLYTCLRQKYGQIYKTAYIDCNVLGVRDLYKKQEDLRQPVLLLEQSLRIAGYKTDCAEEIIKTGYWSWDKLQEINTPVAEKVMFELTDEEAYQIAAKKIECIKNLQKGYEIDNLQFVDIDNDGNYLFTADGYFTKTKEHLDKAEIKIGKFYGQFSMGYVEHKLDYNLNQYIYSIMFEKYGEAYRRMFIFNHLNIASARYHRGANFATLSGNFRRALAIAGSKPIDLEKMIKEGTLDFETDLEPLVSHYEEENISMEDVMNSITDEDNSANLKEVENPPVAKKREFYEVQQTAPERVILELTDDEAYEIIEKQINHMWKNGSTLAFHDGQISGDGDLYKGVVVEFNKTYVNPKEGAYPTKFVFNMFTADYYIGDRTFRAHPEMMQLFVDKMIEKYPNDYPRMFAKFAVIGQNKMYEKFGDIEKSTRMLVQNLAYIGKKSHDPEELVRYGLGVYKFNELADVKEDENE